MHRFVELRITDLPIYRITVTDRFTELPTDLTEEIGHFYLRVMEVNSTTFTSGLVVNCTTFS